MDKGPSQFITIFLSSLLLWLLLAGSVQSEEIIAGIVISLIATFLTISRTSLFDAIHFSPLFPFYIFLFLASFFKALFIANLDMARRVISPSLPIEPGLVRVKTGLQSELGKLLLANSITLTPGTLSVDVDGDEILVHWISCPADMNTAIATEKIAEAFEKHIRRFLK